MTEARLVRVPAAWGTGGERMAEAAYHELPYEEAVVIEAETLAEQTRLVAAQLPVRPVILGGCCCSHVGVIEALSRRAGRLAVVWVDAHGDLNTPETSPSGNEWGMPLRMAIDAGSVAPADVALVGARSLDPAESQYIDEAGIHVGEDALARALEGADAVYVAFDADSVEPGVLAVFMPEPNGLTLEDAEALLRDIASRARVAGAGFTGLVRDRANEPKLARLAAALRL